MISMVGGWLLFGLLCVVFELSAPGLFYCLSFALATMPTAAAAWYDVSFAAQTVIFFASSFVAFSLLYLFVRRTAKTGTHYKSNVDALPGKKGIVIKKITSNHVGQVQIEGEIWSAQSLKHEQLETGTSISVIRVEGVRLIVTADQQS